MNPTIADVIATIRPNIKKQPAEVQLELLWLLFEAVAADTAQLQAYVDALHESFTRYADTVQNYPASNAARVQKIITDIENLAQKL